MALTAVQKQKILKYIGWPDKFIKEDDSFFSGTIKNRLDALSPEAEADTIEYLNQCIAIDQQQYDARERFPATSVGNIRLNRQEIDMLEREKNRIIGEMQLVTFIFPPSQYNFEVY